MSSTACRMVAVLMARDSGEPSAGSAFPQPWLSIHACAAVAKRRVDGGAVRALGFDAAARQAPRLWPVVRVRGSLPLPLLDGPPRARLPSTRWRSTRRTRHGPGAETAANPGPGAHLELGRDVLVASRQRVVQAVRLRRRVDGHAGRPHTAGAQVDLGEFESPGFVLYRCDGSRCHGRSQ